MKIYEKNIRLVFRLSLDVKSYVLTWKNTCKEILVTLKSASLPI